MRQIGMAALQYADDNKQEIWIDVEWNYIEVDGQSGWTAGDEEGHLYEYVNNAHEIGECPTNRRRGVGKGRDQQSVFDNVELNFDYCMQSFTSGYRIGYEVRAGYIAADKANVAANLTQSNYETMTYFSSVPIFWEESTWWYNDEIRDGLWGNQDQVTTRHSGGGHYWQADGTAVLFQGPNDGDEAKMDRKRDFESRDIYVSNKRGYNSFWRVYDNANRRPYGWINNPRQK